MTLIALGLACPHLGRQPGVCTGRHRWLAGIALARWLEPPLPTLGLLGLPPLAALFLWRWKPGPRLAPTVRSQCEGQEVLFLALFGDDYHVLTQESAAAELVKQVTREFQHQHIAIAYVA
jgi:hypothetical protein